MVNWSMVDIYEDYYLCKYFSSSKRPKPETIRGSKKVLIISQSGIGNLILTLPLIETIAKRLDHPKVDLLVSQRGGASLMKNLDYVNEVFASEDPKRLGRKGRKELFKKFHDIGYDMCVTSFISNNIESGLIAVKSKAKVRVVHVSPARLSPDKLYNIVVERRPNIHEVQLNLDLARGLGLEPINEVPVLPVALADMDWAHSFLREQGVPEGGLVLGFHPGCYSDMVFKRWPKFDQLGRLLIKELGASVVVMGGPDEKDLASATVEGAGKGAILSAGKATLGQTAALMKCCSAYVANDSGLMHMAGSVGTPVVAIFGPTDLIRAGPAGKSVIVRHEMDCTPCYVLPGDKIGCQEKMKCLEAISPEEVFEAVKKLLGKS